MEVIYGNTIGLGRDERTCFIYDHRSYCQTVLQSQNLLFGVIPDTCGSNLVVDGDFPTEASLEDSWDGSEAGGIVQEWIWDDGCVRHGIGNTLSLYQNNILTAGRYYKFTITVNRWTSPYVDVNGTLSIYLGTVLIGQISSSGTYTFYGTSDDDYLRLLPTSDFDGCVDDISIYEYPREAIAFAVDENGTVVGTPLQLTFIDGIYYAVGTFSDLGVGDGCYTVCISVGCDYIYTTLVTNGSFTGSASGWTLGANWAYGTNEVCHAGLGAGALEQTLTPWLLPGITYSVTFTLSGRTAGSVDVSLGGSAVQTCSINQSYLLTFTTPDPLTHNGIKFQASATFDGCIDTVSVVMNSTEYVSDACSACLSIQATQDDCQMLLSWTNDDAGFGIDYPSFIGGSPEYINQMRVRAYLRLPKWDEDETEFRGSSGTLSKLYFRTDKSKELFIEQIPEYMCDALSIAKGHDHFYIDGVEYEVQGGFEPEFTDTPENVLAKVKLRVRKKTFLMENKNC